MRWVSSLYTRVSQYIADALGYQLLRFDTRMTDTVSSGQTTLLFPVEDTASCTPPWGLLSPQILFRYQTRGPDVRPSEMLGEDLDLHHVERPFW